MQREGESLIEARLQEELGGDTRMSQGDDGFVSTQLALYIFPSNLGYCRSGCVLRARPLSHATTAQKAGHVYSDNTLLHGGDARAAGACHSGP